MNTNEKPIIAIMYDFDKTLSTTDMQDYGFIPALGMKPEEFEHYGAFLATMNQFLGGYDSLVQLIRTYMVK